MSIRPVCWANRHTWTESGLKLVLCRYSEGLKSTKKKESNNSTSKCLETQEQSLSLQEKI